MSYDFFAGFVFCMIADVFFSVANYFVQQAFKLRSERKQKR